MASKRKPSAERRLEIIKTAWEILVSEGFHKLTLRNVARKVGIKLASLQYHYSNRAVLVKAMFEQATAHYDSKITKFLSMVRVMLGVYVKDVMKYSPLLVPRLS